MDTTWEEAKELTIDSVWIAKKLATGLNLLMVEDWPNLWRKLYVGLYTVVYI